MSLLDALLRALGAPEAEPRRRPPGAPVPDPYRPEDDPLVAGLRRQAEQADREADRLRETRERFFDNPFGPPPRRWVEEDRR